MKRTFAICAAVLAAIMVVASCGTARKAGYSDSFEKKKNRNKVWVGISRNGMPENSRKNYAKCIHDAGAAIYFFPTYPANDSVIGSYLDKVHCLIIPGSTSKDTAGRMDYDLQIVQAAYDRQMPLFGICFGHQTINKAFGGKITRVAKSYPKSELQHAIYVDGKNVGSISEAHSISIDTTSVLYKIYGTDSLMVNTSHRYCTTQVPEYLKITAKAPDGVVEALEAPHILGLQFHPEYMYGRMKLKKHLKYFNYVKEEGAKYKALQAESPWSREGSWYKPKNAVDTNFADVFYLVSTNILRDTALNGSIRYRASLTDEQKTILGYEIAHMEKNAFNDSLNFFSPLYHQYTMDAVGLDKEEFLKVFQKIADETYEAFCYYFDNLRGNRKFVLAGFSQGAQLTKEIVKRMTPQQREKMAAAYLLGWGVNDQDLQNPAIVPAKGAFDKGVVVSFNTVSDNEGIWNVVMDNASYCINPVNWKTDDTPATFTYKGKSYKIHLDPATKVLVVDGFEKEQLPFAEPWPANCLHHYEIMFYNQALNQNAKDRLYR